MRDISSDSRREGKQRVGGIFQESEVWKGEFEDVGEDCRGRAGKDYRRKIRESERK